MVSVGASLDSAISGLQRNVDAAIKTVSQLSRETEVSPPSGDASSESRSDSVGGSLDVTA